MNEETTISGQDAATLLGVSYSHLYTLIKRGLLTRIETPDELRAHAPLRFRRAEVEALHARVKKSSKSRSAA